MKKRVRRDKYLLRLYVSRSTLRSKLAVVNITRVCKEHLDGRYRLEVIDIRQQAQLARDEQIVAVPTLIKRLPLPLQRLVGDMSNLILDPDLDTYYLMDSILLKLVEGQELLMNAQIDGESIAFNKTLSVEDKAQYLVLLGRIREFLSKKVGTAPTVVDVADGSGLSVLDHVTARSMVQLLHKQSALSDRFISHMLARNIRIEEDLVDQLFNSSEKRLARLLLLLSHFGKDSKSETVVAGVNQEHLAQMVGTTRSRINHFMNKFRKLGLIEYNGQLKVHSSLLNVIVRE